MARKPCVRSPQITLYTLKVQSPYPSMTCCQFESADLFLAYICTSACHLQNCNRICINPPSIISWIRVPCTDCCSAVLEGPPHLTLIAHFCNLLLMPLPVARPKLASILHSISATHISCLSTKGLNIRVLLHSQPHVSIPWVCLCRIRVEKLNDMWKWCQPLHEEYC